MNLFTFDQDIGQRLEQIKDEVNNADVNDNEQCNDILEHFHSACNPNSNSCSKANEQSFQGMDAATILPTPILILIKLTLYFQNL